VPAIPYAQIVRELGQAVNTLIARVDYTEKDTARIETTHTKTVEALQALDRALQTIDKRLALVEHQLAELRSARKEWSNRLWTALFSLASAVLGAGIIYYLGFKK